MIINPLSNEFKACLKKLLGDLESYISWVDNGENVQIVLSKDFLVELDSTATTVFFSGFENVFYGFDYDSYESYATSIYNFIEKLMTNKVRIVKEYKDKVLSKSSIYILDNFGWKKIATNKPISFYHLLVKRNIKTEEFYYRNRDKNTENTGGRF